MLAKRCSLFEKIALFCMVFKNFFCEICSVAKHFSGREFIDFISVLLYRSSKCNNFENGISGNANELYARLGSFIYWPTVSKQL